MDLDLAPAIESFLEEAADFVVQLEEDIMALEESPEDSELINSAFRAAHTIKGSGGLFGFDQLVKFTHVFESVLMLMRDGTLVLNKEIAETLLAGVDHLGQMLRHIDLDGEAIPEDIVEAGDQLGMMLEMFMTSDETPASAPTAEAAPAPEAAPAASAPTTSGESSSENWHISLRFGENILRHGMDPASFLRYLQRLGEIRSLKALTAAIPDLDSMDPEQNYLGFEIQINSDSDQETLEDVFEFVQEQSIINVIPPQAPLSRYRELIDQVPESEETIGAVLVETGALSEDELANCLSGEAPVAAPVAAAPSDDVEIQEREGGQCLVIASDMTIYKAEQLAAKLNSVLNDHPEPLKENVALDLTAVEEMDTSGAQLLVSLKKTLVGSGSAVGTVVHGDASKALFELYRLELSPS